jgi:hypothetical protein
VLARVDKIIITNMKALKAKYGTEVSRIKKAARALIEADAARGLKSSFLALDDVDAMARLRVKAVVKHENARQNKTTIDSVCRALQPDYVMILGASDIVPQQRLNNPVFDPRGDRDEIVPSDLPYACDGRHAGSISAFLGPTRVVGRLPDLTDSGDPERLENLLIRAAEHRPRHSASLLPYFSLSTNVWRNSTALSLNAIFGNADDLRVAPPEGGDGIWSDELLARRTHYFNCHGAPADPHFYGQGNGEFPVAHAAARLAGRITPGTLVAAECCYGGELYDPTLSAGQPSIADTYLFEGAAGYFGSSTIAYGPADSNDAADLICQYFMKYALQGASLGRAVLQARLDFMAERAPLDPYNAKTLAQFNLLGDPSLHAVTLRPELSLARPRQRAGRRGYPDRANRAVRRQRLCRMGRAVALLARSAERVNVSLPARIRHVLLEAAEVRGAAAPRVSTYQTDPNTAIARKLLPPEAADLGQVRFYCASTSLEKVWRPGVSVVQVVVATQVDGELVLHKLHSK